MNQGAPSPDSSPETVRGPLRGDIWGPWAARSTASQPSAFPRRALTHCNPPKGRLQGQLTPQPSSGSPLLAPGGRKDGERARGGERRKGRVCVCV